MVGQPAEDQGRLSRRQFLARSGSAAVGALAASGLFGSALALAADDAPAPTTQPDGARPNIVFILTDDQRITDFGCYGNKKAITPVVDALAARGVRFTDAMVTCPVCGPSRVNLLTGRYLSRFVEAPFNEKCSFPVAQPTVASILKAAGYQTGIVGKMHFRITGVRGEHPEQLRAAGFTFVENVHGYDANPGIHLNEQAKAFDSAIKFVKENKDRPFALFVFTTLTHGPFEAPQKYQEMVRPNGGKMKEAMTTWLDTETGRLLAELERQGLTRQTAVFYCADNAPASGGGDNNKSTCYDGRIAQIISWPGGGAGQGVTCDAVTQNIDYLPTMLEMCGVPMPAAARPDGISFLPLLRGKQVDWRKTTFLEYAAARAVRTERWKYIAVRSVKGYPDTRMRNVYGGQNDLLFDLKADPDEKKNLFKDPAQAATVKELQALLREHCSTYSYPFGEFGGGPGK